MIPWVIGIREFQLRRMDKEFAEMSREYRMHWGAQFVGRSPEMVQVIPTEKEIRAKQAAPSYEQVSGLIQKAQSLAADFVIRRVLLSQLS